MSNDVRSARAMTRSGTIVAVIAGIVALAGCGGGPSVNGGTTSGSAAGAGVGAASGSAAGRGGGTAAADRGAGTAAPTLASFADQYLAIAKVADEASAKANAGASHVFTQADQVALFRPLIAAEVTCDNLLLKVPWPTRKIATDVQLMVAASGVLTQDQAAVGGLSAAKEAAWITQTSADAATAQQAANVVRGDLGLAAGP